MSEIRIQEVKAQVLADNDAAAAALRKKMEGSGVFLINLMGSPGAGKTTTLVRMINALKEDYRIGVMEADVDSVVDAEAVAAAGAKALQLHTGGSCHMDASMTEKGLDALDVSDLDIVVLENVGNLVCPAEFDVGAAIKVTLLSVPEGDDKPLKYPLMFQITDCVLISKMDTAPVFHFDVDRFRKNVAPLHPDLPVYPMSAKTGEGFDEWIAWLRERIETWRGQHKA